VFNTAQLQTCPLTYKNLGIKGETTEKPEKHTHYPVEVDADVGFNYWSTLHPMKKKDKDWV